VLYFAQAREAAGTPSEDFSLPSGSSVQTVLTRSMSAHRSLRRIQGTIKVALNEEIAQTSAALADGDVVALLPPVAGG
jgi:molybdopterin converting factor subunit 1